MRLLLKITTVITLIILGNINSALAQNEHPGFDINTVVVNYMSAKVQDSRLSPLGNNLMGEQHDLDTGILSFRHVDVSLPGNSDIPVEFGRQTNIVSFLANGATHKGVLGTSWATNTPYVRVRGDTGQTGNCRATISDYRAKEAFDIGTKVKLLSGGEQSAGPHLKSFGLVLCKSGGGFLVKTPNGHTYEMTKKFIYTDTYDLNDPNLQPNSFVLDNAFWHVTKITDAHNNWVQYSYNQYGVNRVWSNDGREITMSYTNDLITQVTTNGRNWLYSYTKADALSRVTLPDGRYWSFGHDEAGMASVNSPIGDACEVDHGRTLHLKHPSGTKARFRLSNHFNVYKNVPSQPVTYGSGSTNNPGTGSKCAPGNIEPYSFAVYALVNKKLTLTNGKEAVWRYEYDERLNANSPNRNDMVDEKTRTIINPEGNKVVHYINRVYNGPQGMTMKVEYFENEASNIPIRVESVDEYVLSEFSSFGDRGLKGSTRTGKIHTLPTRKVIIQNGDTFTTEYDYDFDENSPTFAYTQPIETLSWSNYSISGESNKRIKKTQYEHNTNKWILNLPKTMHQNGRLIWSVDYTAEGEVHKAYEYNQPLPNAKYDYYSNGTVSKVTDALERVTEVANWKRGKPQLITRNDGFSISLSLDDNGWIMSQTDAKGRTTAYQRDSMGRLTRITPHTPIAGEGGYKLPDTTIHYTFGDTTVQMITTGSKRDFVYYDSLFRPYLDLTYDRQTNKKVMNYTGYDALGRVTFKSQPSDVWGVTKGTDISYDALGRITESRENVAPYATTTHEYLNYHRKKVTDPEGNAVTTYQYGWDGPDSGVPYLIRQHGVTDTWIRRNEHGEIWRVDQTGSSGGVSVNQKQHFYYDSNRRLCRTRTPEGGDTIYQYNHANELTGYIKGQSASAYCPDQISGNAKVTLTYDDLGRLENTLYTDPNTPDITRDYDLNGNITKLHRGSGADSVNWDYAYDGNDMLTDEELVVGGSKAFDIRYKYNALGHMYRKYLPSGKGLSYFNDGLGRHKKVSWGSATYADNASYHPSGPLESLTFGNDQVFTQTLNTRLMPERLKVSKNGTDVQNLYYDYYADGRIKHKLNYVDSTYSAIHFYDSAGRLEQANSAAWGGASFKYDPLGNLREKTFSDWKGSARTVINNYDSRNRISGTTDPRRITYGFNHDNRGNVIKTGNLSFTYDMSDQPVAMTGDAPNTRKNIDASYLYDGNMKRVRSIIDSGDGNGPKTIYNVYDAAGRLVHVDEEGGGETDYLHGMGQTLARIKDGTFTYLHPDHLGSPQVGTNEAGSVSFKEHYTPFGEALLNPAANDNQSGFTGHIKDKGTGLNYMQARYYDPNIGRFLSIDPVDFVTSGGNPTYFNRYAYVGNDPINMIDPFGLCGSRYDDGSCQVKVDADTGQAGIDAGKKLESGLNELDKQINSLDPESSFDVTNSDGDKLGSFTGEELQDAWNNQEWSISGTDHGNGGLGGTVSGSSIVQPEAVTGYAAHASATGQGSRAGVNTLILHETGHAFGPGLALAKAHPVTGGQPNPISERGASAQGRSIGRAIGKGFSCSTPGKYGC